MVSCALFLLGLAVLDARRLDLSKSSLNVEPGTSSSHLQASAAPLPWLADTEEEWIIIDYPQPAAKPSLYPAEASLHSAAFTSRSIQLSPPPPPRLVAVAEEKNVLANAAAEASEKENTPEVPQSAAQQPVVAVDISVSEAAPISYTRIQVDAPKGLAAGAAPVPEAALPKAGRAETLPATAKAAASATATPAKAVSTRTTGTKILGDAGKLSAEAGKALLKATQYSASQFKSAAQKADMALLNALTKQQRTPSTERSQGGATAAHKPFNPAQAAGLRHVGAEVASKAPPGHWISGPDKEFSAEARRLEEEAIVLEAQAKVTQELANNPRHRADHSSLTRLSRYEMAKQQRVQCVERRQEAEAAEKAFHAARAAGKSYAEAEAAAKEASREEKNSRITADEAIGEEAKKKEASRQRLSALLEKHHMRKRPVKGDGNCQFRSLADQLYADQLALAAENHHAVVRKKVVEQLRSFPERYSGFVTCKWDDYLTEMAQDGTWGDNVTLQAAADAFGLKINLLTDYFTDEFIEVTPAQQKSTKVLTLAFSAEVHYDSIEHF